MFFILVNSGFMNNNDYHDINFLNAFKLYILYMNLKHFIKKINSILKFFIINNN